ncbi:NUDIX domain-containing protein [Actinokineospora spheciospongiae]|uniref:NUDIX domain-containing protein n=1 Tax=Actinokineospora spheciospongiae TaxID=909613 RepID=UPI000D7170C3|nr:NUDIX domain-containing protein [Actinokineospora spheciospongiae]PWW56186.1 NUDIX domain-containing protein [Actinokineospora spheciospongiae]
MTMIGSGLVATVLVVDGAGSVLVVARNGSLELPSGVVRVGEAVVEAAARVVAEQTGVAVGDVEVEGLDGEEEFSVLLRARPAGGDVAGGGRWVAVGEPGGEVAGVRVRRWGV